MRLPRPRSLLLVLAPFALATAFSASARQNPVYEGSAAIDASKCSTVTGPFKEGKGTYFKAENHCKIPLHCRVWINWQEPPIQIHLDAGNKGRIDVGPTEATDKFSHDCVTPGVTG